MLGEPLLGNIALRIGSMGEVQQIFLILRDYGATAIKRSGSSNTLNKDFLILDTSCSNFLCLCFLQASLPGFARQIMCLSPPTYDTIFSLLILI